MIDYENSFDSGAMADAMGYTPSYENSFDNGAMSNAVGSSYVPDYDSYDVGSNMVENAMFRTPTDAAQGETLQGGAAPGGLDDNKGKDWIKGMLDYAQTPQGTTAAIATIGAFAKGFFGQAAEKKKADAQAKYADATALNAQSADEKWRKQMENASSIGKTNFGIMQTPKYKDLSAERRARNGMPA